MPALIATDIIGTITWLGLVPDREASLQAEPVASLNATFAGIPGESHSGLTRPSCGRVRTQYRPGTEIRNTRQLSILSAEEITAIAAEMGVEALDPALLGATMVVSGIPDFTHLPPSARLQAPSGATLTIDMANRPCVLPAPVIDKVHPGHGKAFKPAAKGRRGVTAWVEREGLLQRGDSLSLHIPEQRPWQP